MPADPPAGAHVTYTQQYRRCGKAECATCRGGGPGHGPYWYAYWRQTGRLRTRYLGRQLPLTAGEIAQPRAITAGDGLRVRTLGGFQVWLGATPVAPDRLSRRSAGVLLKALLAAPGYRLHREQAEELLWPDATPAAAAANLRLATYWLRKALDADGVSHLTTMDHWLALLPSGGATMPGDWLDAAAFARAASQALASHTRAACCSALDLYTGEYLPDDLYAEWAVRRREELRELYLALLLQLATIHTEQRNARGALDALRGVLEVDPCHEEAALALMRLHAADGRRTEAIRVYRRVAAALKRELDISPSTEMGRLFESLQRPALPDGASAPATELTAASNATPLARRGNLPQPAASFVGRRAAVSEIRRLLLRSQQAPRALTLIGPGGCGKTLLALQVARSLTGRYRDGVWLVELAGLADPAFVASTVAAVLGAQEVCGADRQHGASATSLLATLVTHLRSRRLLLVLDQCEHLATACATLVSALLAGCPQVRVLATSREPLPLEGEVIWRVPPLSCPAPAVAEPLDVATALQGEAVQLFVARARPSRPGFSLTPEGVGPVLAICRRLGGLPLAIELAAARSASPPLQTLAQRLESSFLQDGADSRAVLPCQQMLEATIDWSHAMLSDRERSLLRRLSVFAGGWTLEAAQVVCVDRDGAPSGGPPDASATTAIAPATVLEMLAQLVARALAQREEPVPAGGAVRYRLLEPIRRYAAALLEAAGETPALQRRHWAWCLALVERAEPELRGSAQDHWLRILDREQDNLRVALEWSMRQTTHAGASMQLAAPLMWYWHTRGRHAEGRRWLARSLVMGGDVAPSLRAGALNQAGILAWCQRDYDEAVRFYEESLAIRRSLGDRRGVAGALNNLGIVASDRGDYARAVELHEESLAIKRELGDQMWIAGSLTNLGLIARRQGDYARAMALYREALGIRRVTSDAHGLITTLNSMGMVALKCGDHDVAHACYGESLAASGDLRYRWGQADALMGLGMVAHNGGDHVRAIALIRDSIALAQEIGDAERGSRYLEALAEALVAGGKAVEAATMLGAAEAARTALHTRLPPADLRDHIRLLDRVRALLSGESYDAAWATGNAMPLEAALAIARG